MVEKIGWKYIKSIFKNAYMSESISYCKAMVYYFIIKFSYFYIKNEKAIALQIVILKDWNSVILYSLVKNFLLQLHCFVWF